MSKEVVVVVRCDKCGGENAATQTEQDSMGKPVEIDLDQPCRHEFEELKAQAAQILAPLTELVDEKGVAPEKATKVKTPAAAGKAKAPTERPGVRPCLVCPESRTSNTGILNHMRDKHGFPHSIPVVYGDVCPIGGEKVDTVLLRHISHAHKEHDFAHISQAFEWAKQHGDPYGVVAARIAELEKMAAAA